jgi:lipopolysaccharide exporter
VTQTSSSMLSSDAIRKAVLNKIGQIRGTDIKARSARGVVALSIGTVAGRGMRFVKNMVLARVLVPDQIGLMAIVMSCSIAFEAFTEVGVKQSVIQNKLGAQADYLNVAWWMQMVRGLCLYSIAFVMAPWISSFYEDPKLLSLLRVAFVAIALRGFVSPRAYVLEKEYKFGRAVFLVQGSAVLGAIVTIVLAMVMRNVWAMVIGFVAETAILCLLSFIVVPFLPRLRIDRASLGELIEFARGIVGLPLLAMISVQAPVLVLGKVISKNELGLYTFAALLASIPTDLYTRIISPVMLPAFSEKQDDKRALSRGLLQVTRYTAFLAGPLIALMVCCGRQLLTVAYGSRYAAMAIPFAVLSVQILAQSEAVILAGLYLAVGRPHLQRRFAIVRAVVIIAFLYPASVRFGALGAVVVQTAGNFTVLLLQALKVRAVVGLKLSSYVRSYAPGLLLALPIIVVVGLLRVLGVDSPLLVLCVGLLAFVATLAAGVLLRNLSRRPCPVVTTLRDLPGRSPSSEAERV